MNSTSIIHKQLIMSDIKTSYSKENFLKLLKENFGPYEIENGILSFRGHTTNKKVAYAIGTGESQFSKLVKLPDNNHEYTRVIDRLILYRDAKKYRTLKVRYYLLLFVLAATSVALAVLFYETSRLKKQNRSINIRSANTGIFLSDTPTLGEILLHRGSSNIHELKWNAIRLNERIRSLNTPLTRGDSIEEIERIRTTLLDVIRNDRRTFALLTYTFPSGKKLSTFLEEHVPIENGKIFNYSAEEMLSITDNNSFKQNATPFDEGVRNLFPIILNTEVDFTLIVNDVEIITKTTQEKILSILNREAKAEFY